LSLLFLALLNYFFNRPKKLKTKTFLLNSSLYLIYVISLIYTADLSKAFKILTETRLTAFLLPLVFLLLSQNKGLYSLQILEKFKNIFISSTVILCLIYLIYLPFIPITANPFFEFPSVYFFRNGMMSIPILGIHPIYASIYIGISMIFIFTKRNKNSIINRGQRFFLLIFTIILIALSSKMVIIALLVITVIYFFKHFRTRVKQKIIFLFSTLFIIVLLFQIPTIKARVKEFLKKETFTEYKRHNSTSIRISILSCGLKISKENLFFGVGVGDVNNELAVCYKSISSDLVYEKYNSHNQFLSILLGSGIFGFLIFCYFLYKNIQIGKLILDKSFYFLVIFFCINFLSENILERQNGVILFYFMICYFSNFPVSLQKIK